MEQEDIDYNNSLLTGSPDRQLRFQQLFATAAHREYMAANKYREMFIKLNKKQKHF